MKSARLNKPELPAVIDSQSQAVIKQAVKDGAQNNKVIHKSKKHHQRPRPANVIWASQEYEGKNMQAINAKQTKPSTQYRSTRKNRSNGSSG